MINGKRSRLAPVRASTRILTAPPYQGPGPYDTYLLYNRRYTQTANLANGYGGQTTEVRVYPAGTRQHSRCPIPSPAADESQEELNMQALNLKWLRWGLVLMIDAVSWQHSRPPRRQS